jgi:HD-GYP domain-containing protein (c-di-GMP phosphodiesterase class II)
VERTVMERHPQIGHRILNESPSPLLQAAATIALSHHERWDGAGYPFGLSGESIPTDGRIVAVVDVFDALTAVRPYRPAYSAEEAAAMMTGGHGVQFDPDILNSFLDLLDEASGREIAVNL